VNDGKSMYKRVLLAADQSRASLVALREGALIARAVGARVFLLVVDPEHPGFGIADTVHLTPRPSLEPLLKSALERLRKLGLEADGLVVQGEPAPLIGAYAKRFAADLVVVGHKRQSALSRWWVGARGAYLADHVECTLLICRNVVSDDDFERLSGSRPAATQPSPAQPV